VFGTVTLKLPPRMGLLRTALSGVDCGGPISGSCGRVAVVDHCLAIGSTLRSAFATPLYEDSVFTRKREGVEVECRLDVDWSRIYPGTRWSTWGGIRMSMDRAYYVLPDRSAILKSTIRRIAGRTDLDEHLWLHRMFTFPNGQVKNFVNACRASFGLGRKMCTVAVVGSKAREGGGTWHRLFAAYLSSLYEEVWIDFYDPAETPSYWQLVTSTSKVTCQWIVEEVQPTMVQDYDIIIDDVWYDGRPGLVKELSHGSLKGSYLSEGYLPFLHPTETRKIVAPCSSYKSPCLCMLCQELAKCSRDFEQYQTLRMMCSRLGHNTSCEAAFFFPMISMWWLIL
jgi:hypothetical protein